MTLSCGVEGDALGRRDDDGAARQALARVVVGVTVQRERHARREPAAERLPGRAGEGHVDRAGRQAVAAVDLGDPRGEHAADAAVDVADRHVDVDVRVAALDHRARALQEHVVQRVVEHRRRRLGAVARLGRVDVAREREQVREVDPPRLPVVDRLVGLKQVDAADQVLHLGDAERGHDAAQLLGHEEEEVDDVLGRALEALAQLRVLRGDADRAGVEVAGAHHDAARRDQRRGREAHLVGAEHRGDGDVAARLELAVGLDDDARAQVVLEQRLLGLGQADLPRRAGGDDRATAARRPCRRRGRR